MILDGFVCADQTRKNNKDLKIGQQIFSLKNEPIIVTLNRHRNNRFRTVFETLVAICWKMIFSPFFGRKKNLLASSLNDTPVIIAVESN